MKKKKNNDFLERGIVRIGNEGRKGRWQHVQARRPSRSFVHLSEIDGTVGRLSSPHLVATAWHRSFTLSSAYSRGKEIQSD
jgi:hypothetical protein